VKAITLLLLGAARRSLNAADKGLSIRATSRREFKGSSAWQTRIPTTIPRQ
jgi:hypothetical protein